MNHFATIDEAREHAAEMGIWQGSVIEFDHATEGRRFLVCRGHIDDVQDAGNDSIASCVAEHALDPEGDAEIDEFLNDHRCERCGCSVDADTCYSQLESTARLGIEGKALAYYCESCRALLSASGQGEQTDLENRCND